MTPPAESQQMGLVDAYRQAQDEENELTTEVHPRACANPNCRRPLPPAQPGHKARLTCGDRCRKAASRLRKQEEARRLEEEARCQRQERWQVFRPSTRSSLERLEALAGAQLAEAIMGELE